VLQRTALFAKGASFFYDFHLAANTIVVMLSPDSFYRGGMP